MTDSQIWALLAILALGGWAASLVLFARATLPMANALAVTNKVDAMVDDRIAKTLERVELRRTRGKSADQQRSKAAPEMIPADAAQRELARVLGGFGEQPDAEGVEILS